MDIPFLRIPPLNFSKARPPLSLGVRTMVITFLRKLFCPHSSRGIFCPFSMTICEQSSSGPKGNPSLFFWSNYFPGLIVFFVQIYTKLNLFCFIQSKFHFCFFCDRYTHNKLSNVIVLDCCIVDVSCV